jgi:tripartite-type tricarboxylate transporter receptor subunit TctC
LVLGLFIIPATSLAEPYYAGKTIKIVLPTKPGGGYDRIAQLIAKHLPKHIPGNPNIIVQYKPGAGSRIATNYLYNEATPDGLTIGAFYRGLPFAQLLKAPGVQFDLTKFVWIGAPVRRAIVLSIRCDLPYRSFDDLLAANETIHFGATGTGGADTYFPLSLKHYLGLKVNMVQYTSGAEVLLAIERKEVDGCALTYGTMKPHIASGLVRPVLRGLASKPGIEDLPVNVDLTTDKEGKTIMSLLSIVGKVGQPYVAPPQTPVDRMKVLRQAFSKWAKDPEVQEKANKFKEAIEYVSAEEAIEVVNYVVNQPPDIIEELTKYIKF